MDILTNELKSKLTNYSEEILEAIPNNRIDEAGDPMFTNSEWLDQIVRIYLKRIIKCGEKKLHDNGLENKLIDLD